jgi:type IV fimbrial biogenesis protein FimT
MCFLVCLQQSRLMRSNNSSSLKTSALQKGFSLIEIMVVIAIMAIMASITAPSLVNMVNGTKLSTVAAKLSTDLNRARSEAIKRNSRVLFCKINTAGTGCTSGTLYHTSGWMVCYDADRDDACDASTSLAPNPIVMHQPLVNMTLTLLRGDASTVPIRFNPNGTQGTSAVTMTLAGSWSGAVSKVLRITATGNISKS